MTTQPGLWTPCITCGGQCIIIHQHDGATWTTTFPTCVGVGSDISTTGDREHPAA